jgi:hypothetical protein
MAGLDVTPVEQILRHAEQQSRDAAFGQVVKVDLRVGQSQGA